MKKIVISTRQVVADIKARIGDAALMEKYALSPRSLINLKKELLNRGLILPADIRPSRTPPNPERKALNAKEFVHAFRGTPDDEYLMQRFNLTPSQLRTVYKKMIDSRLLSEYEYYMRQAASPPVDEPVFAPQPISSVIEEVDAGTNSRVPAGPVMDHGLPKDFFTDYSGIKIGQGSNGPPMNLAPDSEDQPTQPPVKRLREQSTVVQLVTCELCPNCARPREDSAAESCEYCGIVFAKAGKRIMSRNIGIWRDDT
jgi:hypothetical protein